MFLSYFPGKLYPVHFNSIPSVNNNQTVAVNYFQETSQGSLTAYKGKRNQIFSALLYQEFPFFIGLSTSDTTSDPVLNVKNILRFRADSILSFNVGGIAPNGAVFAMVIYPYSGGSPTQALFSIRDGSTNSVSFAAELSDSTNEITFYRKDSITGLLTAVATPSLPLPQGNFYFLSRKSHFLKN